MALFSKGSAENRLTDIQRDKLPIRAVDVHKTKRVSTTHWLTNWGGVGCWRMVWGTKKKKKTKSIENQKRAKFLLLHLKMAGVARACTWGVAGGG